VNASKPIELQGKNIILGILGRFPFERVLLGDQIIDAAAEAPDVNLLREVHLLHDKLGGRVIDVPREVLSLQQLLEIEGHAY